MAKIIRSFLKNLFEYYFLNITVSTTLIYCNKYALNKKLKLMGGAMKYFLKKLLGHEIFWSMVSWATKFVLKNL